MTDPIRTRPDGSIDTAHYLALGRKARSEAAHELFARREKPARQVPGGRVGLTLLIAAVAMAAVPALL